MFESAMSTRRVVIPEETVEKCTYDLYVSARLTRR